MRVPLDATAISPVPSIAEWELGHFCSGVTTVTPPKGHTVGIQVLWAQSVIALRDTDNRDPASVSAITSRTSFSAIAGTNETANKQVGSREGDVSSVSTTHPPVSFSITNGTAPSSPP